MHWKNKKTNKQLHWKWKKPSKRKKRRELSLRTINYRRNMKNGIMQKQNNSYIKKKSILDFKILKKKLKRKLNKLKLINNKLYKNTSTRKNKDNLMLLNHMMENLSQMEELVVGTNQWKLVLGIKQWCRVRVTTVHRLNTN